MDAARLHRLLIVLTIAGIALSAYAAFEVLSPVLAGACSVNLFLSCQSVLRSGHTTFPPGSAVPDWSWGLGGFLLLLGFEIPLVRTYEVRWLWAATVVALFGLAIAAVFAYIEVAIIGALCPVCVGAYAADTGILAVCLALLRLRRKPEIDSDSVAAKDTAADAPGS